MTAATLEALDLTFAYPGTSVPVFRDLSMVVGAGEMVAVRGPSGSGKSTLLYLLGLFITPDTGRILLAGQDTARLGDVGRSRLRAHRIGFVFQDAALHLGLTIEENVAEGVLYGGATHEGAIVRARALMEAYGIASFAGRRPTEISGGQAQRVALCRALVRRPALVLADEPTGNLDPDNAEAVIAGLRAAATDGTAVVIVTHNPGVADACDRTVTLAVA